MTALFLAVSFLIAYGSLYPFSFTTELPPPEEIERFLGTLRWTGGRSDILSNIALFLPLGFLGAFLPGQGRRGAAGFAALVLWALFLAFGLQAAQLFLAARNAALSDGLWNMLGGAIGLLAGLAAARRQHARGHDGGRAIRDLLSFPVLLCGCWLAYRLAPYVPTADWQSVKDSLKPLLLAPALGAADALRNAAGWMAFAALWHGWRGARWSDRPVLPAVLAVMAAEVLIVDNAVTLSNVAGAAAGIGLWWAVKGTRARYAVAALAVGVAVVWIGLEPFAFGDGRQAFLLVPFGGLLDGSMYVNFQQLLLKFYLYGALVWLLTRAGAGRRLSIAGVALGLLAIEIAQAWMPGKTPEITDPLLALAAAWTMHLLDRRQGAGKPAAAAA